MDANSPAPVAIAALTQDRALIGLLRSVVDPSSDLIFVASEGELTPHLNGRRVSVALLDSMFIESDLGAMAERMRDTWPDLVLIVVGTADEQTKVAAQITSGVVYRFLHRPVSAPRVRLFVDAALRRHEVENVERTLEQTRPDFSRFEAARATSNPMGRRPAIPSGMLPGIVAAALLVLGAAVWFGFTSDDSAGDPPVAEAAESPVVSEPAVAPRAAPAAESARPVEIEAPADTPAAPLAQAPMTQAPTTQAPTPSPGPASIPAAEPVQAPSRAAAAVVQLPVETTQLTPAPTLSHEQRLREQLAQAEAALQRGELASPRGRNAVDLFRGALDLDPSNSLAKAGLIRVADRLLSAAERALTAGNPEDAKAMVDVAETLTPATARGAFLMMQIEKEYERAALTRARDSDAQSKQDKAATYLRLANARLRSGALIEPSEDNARFYLEAARQVAPEDPALADTARALQRELLNRAATAANTGDAADTERWLANADGEGAARQDMTGIRRSLQDTLISARADRLTTLAQSFTSALSANRLLAPANDSAKSHLLAIINTDAGNPAVSSGRQGLGAAYLREMRGALARDDLAGAATWLNETRIIGFAGDDLAAAEAELAAAREKAAQPSTVVGAGSLQRIEYVAPVFPTVTRNRATSGWVELEFTVNPDGSTGDIVVTNSSPRNTFDTSALTAVRQWRYKPVMRDGKPVEQRVAVRIRYSGE